MALGGFGMHGRDLGLACCQARNRHPRRIKSGSPVCLIEGRRAAANDGRKDDIRCRLFDALDDFFKILRPGLQRNIDLVENPAPPLHNEVRHQAIGFVWINVVRADKEKTVAEGREQITRQLQRVLVRSCT